MQTINLFKDQLKDEQKRIQRLIDLAGPMPDLTDIGTLSLDPRGKTTYCSLDWYRKRKRIKHQYLGTIQSEPARAYATTRYRAELLQRLQSNQSALLQLEQDYIDYDYSSVTASLPKACQKVLACGPSGSVGAFDERYEELRRWATAPYERNPTPFPKSENYAVDGTRTRSKGETIFYNIFYDLGVLFRFDCVLRVSDGRGGVRLLCPDFLIQCFDGTFIAIEHLGWRTGIEYGIGFGEKCYYYLKKGFILGKNYFVTSDDFHGGTDSEAIEMIAQLVCRLFYGW